jgi:protein-tyrosine phosphatase
MKPYSVLMVCLGNICRSPLAEGILRHHLPASGFRVDSAGTSGYHINDAPDPRSVKVAKKYGIDISGLKGRQFEVADFDRFDRIYVMDCANKSDVLFKARNDQDRAKVQLILDEIFPNENAEVPDPYYGEMRDFEAVYHMLNEACELIANELTALNKSV